MKHKIWWMIIFFVGVSDKHTFTVALNTRQVVTKGNKTLHCIYGEKLVPVNSSWLCSPTPIQKWEPRVTQMQGWFVCGVPTFFAVFYTILVLQRMTKVADRVTSRRLEAQQNAGTEKDEEHNRYWVMARIHQCMTLARWAWIRREKPILCFKLIWDAADVIFDSLLFFRLEMGEVLDIHIYRNTYVNDAILAFACFGSLKITAWYFFTIYKKNGQAGIEGQEELGKIEDSAMLAWKLYMTALSFILEDGPQLYLEYLYIEKYIDARPPWYLMGKDVVYGTLALYIMIDAFVLMFSCLPKFTHLHHVYLALSVLWIGMAMLLRVVAAIIQYVDQTVKISSFEFRDAKLYQTPHKSMKIFEIIFLSLFEIGAYIGLIMVVVKICWRYFVTIPRKQQHTGIIPRPEQTQPQNNRQPQQQHRRQRHRSRKNDQQAQAKSVQFDTASGDAVIINANTIIDWDNDDIKDFDEPKISINIRL